MAKKDAPISSFGVQLTGLGLPPEAVASVSHAVQRAVLAELADLDIAPTYTVRLQPSDEENLVQGHPTNGIWIDSVGDDSG
jgi:hypothetical protein